MNITAIKGTTFVSEKKCFKIFRAGYFLNFAFVCHKKVFILTNKFCYYINICVLAIIAKNISTHGVLSQVKFYSCFNNLHFLFIHTLSTLTFEAFGISLANPWWLTELYPSLYNSAIVVKITLKFRKVCSNRFTHKAKNLPQWKARVGQIWAIYPPNEYKKLLEASPSH